MSTLWEKIKYSDKIYLLFIALIFLIGFLIRIKGLGKWPLALDEYYIIKSSQNILEYGLPQFPNGGYYSRGILIQYIIAFFLNIGIKPELAGRIIPLISSLLAFFPLYFLSRKLGNKVITVIVMLIFSFSIWEIEFARFARMYTPFQAIFIWYVFYSIKNFESKDFEYYLHLIGLSFLSIFVYEASIFLAALNFIPFIIKKKINFKFFGLATIVLLIALFINFYNFRTMDSLPITPTDYHHISATSFPIKFPKVFLLYSFESVIFSVLTIILIAFNIFVFKKISENLTNKNIWSFISIILLVISALFNQFGLLILLFLISSYWSIIEFSNNNKTLKFLGLLFGINLIFWICFGLLSDSWFSLFDDFSSYQIWGISKKLLIALINYPDTYYTFLEYVKSIPIVSIFSLFVLLIFSFFLLYKKQFAVHKYLFGLFILVLILATIPVLPYYETRYTFFAVPLGLLLVITGLHEIISFRIKNNNLVAILTVLIGLTTFIISRDFNFYHMSNIDDEKVNYRMIYKNNRFKKHLYRRWDILTPIKFVNSHANKDDIIMINENSHEFYLPRVDYFSFDSSHFAFRTISVNYGKKERWSNAKLIYSQKDLENFINNRERTIWFTVYPENYLVKMNFYKKYEKYFVISGIDNIIKLYKFPKP